MIEQAIAAVRRKILRIVTPFQPRSALPSVAPVPLYSVLGRSDAATPLVLASPHSGRVYDPAFVASSRLGPRLLRRSEDAFVEQIYAAAPQFGSPLLAAHFPRVFVDVNREAYELDARMFAEPLPGFVNTRSPRVAAGLGTIARLVASGEEIYPQPLAFAEALDRIRRHYFPYHAALQALLDAACHRHGGYVLIDCHSMPSIGGPMDADPGLHRLDIVLGDCHGSSCSPELVSLVERSLTAEGLNVRRNVPYAGGYTTRAYADPHRGRHALQIEINRALYMDENQIVPTQGLDRLREVLTRLIASLSQLNPLHLPT